MATAVHYLNPLKLCEIKLQLTSFEQSEIDASLPTTTRPALFFPNLLGAVATIGMYCDGMTCVTGADGRPTGWAVVIMDADQSIVRKMNYCLPSR